MAEVLAGHQLYVSTSHGDAWQPPEESASCSCGVDLGGWVASGADWEWPDGWGKEYGEHVAEQLAANGYGKLEDAWDRGMGDMAKLMKAGPGYEMGNPYRRPE